MKRITVGLFILLALSACLPSSTVRPAETPDAAALQTMAVATLYAQLTATAAVPLTATPTAAFTPSPTATPALDFGRADVVSLGYSPSKEMQIIVFIPNLFADAGEYRGRISVYEYRCEREANYPEWLFCYGRGFKPQTLRTFELLPLGSDKVLFTHDVTIPEIPIPGDLGRFLRANCEVEPLYQPMRPELGWAQNPGNDGCYAITCYEKDPNNPDRTVWKCGTENTCNSMPDLSCP